MQWERRTPMWPKVVALGLLFVLALAAPRSWQTAEGVRDGGSDQPSSTEANVVEAEVPLLPPIDPVAAVGPTLTEPVIPPSPEISARPEFDFDTLLSVRDRLFAIIDQLPELAPVATEPAEPEPEAQPRQVQVPVRVSSESDRLAMLPLPRQLSSDAAATPEPLYRPEPNFADFQLTPPEPVAAEPTVDPVPQLAMVPDLADPQVADVTEVPAAETIKDEPLAEEQFVEETPVEVAPPVVARAPIRHRPEALVEQLATISPASQGAGWSKQVLAALDQLTADGIAERMPASEALAELDRLYTAAHNHLQSDEPTVSSNQLRRVTNALGRRLVIWRVLLDPQQPHTVESAPADESLPTIVDDALQLLSESDNGEDWRSYLQLDRAVELTSPGIESPTLARAKLAQEILARMTDAELSEAQLAFLQSDQLIALGEALRPWAAGKVNLETLAALMERYESGRQNRYAEAIAQLQIRLKWSDDARMQQLAEHLNQHYRGANMRIAMSDFLMNRMIPQQKPIVSPVRDSIAGAKVRGRARTTTELRVRLQPDAEAWHVRLEANGKVYSHTRSDTWPARIRNAAKMQYQGHKDISISEQGVKMLPAQATARGRNELVGVDSELDTVPLVGYLLRDFAKKKHTKSRPTANSQAKAKVVRQVKERMDTGLAEKLDAFEQKFRDKVLAPIEDLALLAEPLDMHTTQKRAVMQLRLANHGQLAAHTLRPYAPSDSVLSVQMHETALNNAMMGLGLDGRRMTLLELFEFLTERLGRTEAAPPEDMPKRAIIQFAKRDAARVRCEGDRLELILSVAELAHRRDKIRNFEIHVHFRPVLSGLSVRLVHDGTLQFSGRRLKTGPRVVLHSVLGKVLPEGQQYTLVSPKLMLDARFKGLMVTQLVLEDGWLGLAIGPANARRTALRTQASDVLTTPFVR